MVFDNNDERFTPDTLKLDNNEVTITHSTSMTGYFVLIR